MILLLVFTVDRLSIEHAGVVKSLAKMKRHISRLELPRLACDTESTSVPIQLPPPLNLPVPPPLVFVHASPAKFDKFFGRPSIAQRFVKEDIVISLLSSPLAESHGENNAMNFVEQQV